MNNSILIKTNDFNIMFSELKSQLDYMDSYYNQELAINDKSMLINVKFKYAIEYTKVAYNALSYPVTLGLIMSYCSNISTAITLLNTSVHYLDFKNALYEIHSKLEKVIIDSHFQIDLDLIQNEFDNFVSEVFK